MGETEGRAARANSLSYDSLSRNEYVLGAPHIRHPHLQRMYDGLAAKTFETIQKVVPIPRILDLGAGEGSVTATYLNLGASVTAVDISAGRLKQLSHRCAGLPGQLEIVCGEAVEAIDTLTRESKQYDLVVATAFLHHVPDYEYLLRRAVGILSANGQILTFEDPLRYDLLSLPVRLFSGVAYCSWRLLQRDLVAGTWRFVRRQMGNYVDASPDNVEYHVVRNGVDQDAICRLLDELGMDSHLVRYFSTQAPFWETIGRHLGVANTFGVVAKWKDKL